MATQYVDIGGSRIASADGVDQSDADDASVTGWYRDIDIFFCHTIYTSKGPLTRQFKLQYENTTDSAGTWNDIGNGSGDIRYDNVVTVMPSDDFTLTSGYRICSIVGGYSWMNGVGNKEDNTILDSGGYTINDEYYTEFQWALNVGNAILGKQYSFRLYDVTQGYAHATFGATLTINTSDIESTGVRLFGEETGGSPDYREDWTNWVNYPAGTAPTLSNGDYGQINGGTVASPVMRVGGADFISILDNFYGSTSTGEYKIYYRSYSSIFPWNTSDSVIQWQVYQKTSTYPNGFIDRTTENYYQIKLEEVTSGGSGIGDQTARIAHGTNLLGNYPYEITCGINGSGLALVAGFMNSSCPFGLNGFYYSYTFRSVTSPGGRTWTEVSAGSLNSAWIDTDSFIWVGAPNSHGFLGQNDTVERTTSLSSPVANNSNFVQPFTNSMCVMAIKGDGSAWSWGYPYMIGDGRASNGSDALTPTSVSGGHTFISIWASGSTAHAIDTDGQVWSWGYNAYLQCGRGGPYNSPEFVNYYSTPVKPIGDHSVASVLSASNNTYFADHYGNIFKMGVQGVSRYYEEGSIALLGNLMDYDIDPKSIVTIWFIPGGAGSFLNTAGEIWAWGPAGYGQLGRNYTHSATSLEQRSQIMGGSVWRAFWPCDAYISFALRDDNKMFGWGLNYYYGIGMGSNYHVNSPIQTGGTQGWS